MTTSTIVGKIAKGIKKSLPVGSAIAIAFSFAPSVLAASFADFVFVVDESGSMSGEHSWLNGMISDLDTTLKGVNVGGRYGLVGYGGGGDTNLGRTISVGGADFGSASDFAAATASLVTSGNLEDGYSALDFAFKNYNFASKAAVNIVLVTDEDRDSGKPTLNYNGILNLFKGKKALLNAVVDHGFSDGSSTALGVDADGNAYLADGSGGFVKSKGKGVATSGFGTTKADYVDLAWATGGAAWDLNQLRAGGLTATSFTKSFVNIKVKEVVEQPPSGGGGNPGGGGGTPGGTKIPEPTSVLSLLAFGAFGTKTILKRKEKQLAENNYLN